MKETIQPLQPVLPFNEITADFHINSIHLRLNNMPYVKLTRTYYHEHIRILLFKIQTWKKNVSLAYDFKVD